MKYFLLILALPAFSGNHCGYTKNIIPACVQKKIDDIKTEAKWNPPGEVNEYTYKGKPVFLITSNCCDQYIVVYDDSCNYICAPSGGMTGKGDGKCPDFYKKAEYVKLIWKDDR